MDNVNLQRYKYIGDDIHDFMTVGYSTQKIMQSLLDDPKAGENGFVADVVALFPSVGGRCYMLYVRRRFVNVYVYTICQLYKQCVREINLSAWESNEAAMKWYKQSDAHNDIVKKYYGKYFNPAIKVSILRMVMFSY